jgi:hypothetical protein
MRIGYATLFILDRLLWTVDLEYFFYQSGVLPTRVTRSYDYIEPYTMLTIFQLAPESDWLVWTVNYLCLLQGILLLLGVAPRFQCASLVVYLASWEHQNDHAWDAQDEMLRFFAFLLCFMPLHRLTIYEWYQTRGMSREEKTALFQKDSWPMWPFRLWQIEICFIYVGAGYAKLSTKLWQRGMAIYYATFTNHFGGIFTPDFLFNRMFPLKFLCWSSLVVECISVVTIWPLTTRLPTLVAIVLLHVGIDLAMNMNIFEWLSILGWMVFLVQPVAKQSRPFVNYSVVDDRDVESTPDSQSKRPRLHSVWTNIFITMFILVYGSITIPISFIHQGVPEAMRPTLTVLKDFMGEIDDVFMPWLYRLGIHQHNWSMFSGIDSYSMYEQFEAIIAFKNETTMSWWTPDWNAMSWLKRKRYRRHQLYLNNLKSFKSDGETAGHRHLCEWIARPFGSDVEKVKLVYHWADHSDPPLDIGWFDSIPRDNFTFTKETQYVYYTPHVCEEWRSEGECHTDAKFMLNHCGETCKQEFDDANDVKIGSKVLVFWKKDSKFYLATVLKKRRDKSKREFYLEWEESQNENEWFDLDTNLFTLLNDGERVFANEERKQSDTTDDIQEMDNRNEDDEL